MTLEEAKHKLYNTTFLLGWFRRRSAIRTLIESPDPAGVVLLAAAVSENHPNSKVILGLLRGLSAEQDADKVAALWAVWAEQPHPGLAEVLADLGWPPERAVDLKTARAVLDVAVPGGVPEFIQAVKVFGRSVRTLVGSPDLTEVGSLAEALSKNHYYLNSDVILGLLRELSPQRDADKVAALWTVWAERPHPGLAEILAELGWPPERAVDLKTARAVLDAADAEAAAEVLRAVSVFARSLNTVVESPDPAGVLLLAEALGKNHPNSEAIAGLLRGLSAEQDADKVAALWAVWAEQPHPGLAEVLADLGWPPERAVDLKTARAVLAVADTEAAPEVLRAISVFARSIPAADETLNDEIYKAWIRSESEEVEQLIAEQSRQPGTPALEALHTLVTGRLERYDALGDNDGALLNQAFAMAPEPFRNRIAQTVAASPDRRLKAAYRQALSGSGADEAQNIANLKLIGDEDGLFEKTRSLRLGTVLDLCEHWASHSGRPSSPKMREVVDRAVEAYGKLGQLQVEPGPKLPEGLVDIFEYWQRQQPSDADLQTDLQAEDPFRKARGLYLGHAKGLVDRQRLKAAAQSEHWPERLVARLVDPATLAEAEEDHVFWVSACVGDGALVQTPIAGTPEDYARHSSLLEKTRGTMAARNRSLLEILCAFQGAFVASGISVHEISEPTEASATVVEDASNEEF